MNYTKVKPTVVKHVLEDQVIHLRQPEVSRLLLSLINDLHRPTLIKCTCTKRKAPTFEAVHRTCNKLLICLEVSLLSDQSCKVCVSYQDKVVTQGKMPGTSLMSSREV